jgi:streptomycin 6-kinase
VSTPRRIQVPRAFAESTVAREGEDGQRWIERLPDRVEGLCEEWGLTIEGPPRHGYVALVVPVVREGTPLALKVSWIDASSEQEALALRVWRGRGAVRLIDARADAGAMLLERLDPDRTLEQEPIETAVPVAAALLWRLSIPAPEGLRGIDDELATMRSFLVRRWDSLGRPFARHLLDAALEAATPPGTTPLRRVVNQDLHYGNVLGATREPWLVIDPKPLAGDPEFGVAPLLWTRFDELTGRKALERRLAIIVEMAELDDRLARRFTLLRLVEYWLWALDEGLTDDPGRCRVLLEWLASGQPG